MGSANTAHDRIRRVHLMRLYRISPEKYLNNQQGLGASYQEGARWNRPGQPVLYFALSPATALLEFANYIPSPRLIPDSYRLGIFEVPDAASFLELPANQLPNDWAQYPYPNSTQKIGGDWLETGTALGMLVPSAAVPEGLEKIVVINPGHPERHSIHLLSSTAELFNKRTFAGL